MQTTSTLFNAPRAAFHAARPIILRSLWKEYRMLRGFWLGVAGLALLEMYVVRALVPSGDQAPLLFGSAWAAAAFYAVGAAITLFAVEREEQTDSFLRLLPRRTWGLLAGKVIAAAATAFLLAGVLLVFASPWPPAQVAADLSVVGAVVVLQFLAWGVFMSFVCPQPLVAAVLAIAVASLGMQFALAASSESGTGLYLTDYRMAAGAQLTLALAVGLVDAWLGRRWLEPRERRSRRRRDQAREAASGETVAEASTAISAPRAAHLPRRAAFGRLFWQSWREGWKPMLAVVPVGLLLMAGDGVSGMADTFGIPLASTWFVIPALWGALVFRADQRGQRYRFLSEHAAPPRAVWLARQAAWLTPLVLGCMVLHAVVRTMWSMYAEAGVVSALVPGESPWIFDQARDNPAQTALVYDSFARSLGRYTMLAWCGALAAYGAGQLCSMLVRSPVMAAFAAIVLAVVIGWWTALAGFWQLPGWLFVAPIGLAALAASFVDSRAWVADRRGLRFWLTPAAVVGIVVALIAVAVPVVREGQVPLGATIGPFARQTLKEILTRWQVDEPTAREAANQYEELAARITGAANTTSVEENGYGVDGGSQWSDGGILAALDGPGGWLPGPAGRQVPRRGWWASFPAAALAANQELFAEAAELSRAPRCRFPESQGRPSFSGAFSYFVTLIIVDAERHLEGGDLDAALERILTLRRIEAHLRQYLRAAVHPYVKFGGPRGDYDGLLLRWATAPGQTSQRVQRALAGLREAEAMFPAFSESIVADYLAVRRTVEGSDPPSFISQSNLRGRQPSWQEKFALVANELPWERRRALAALEYMTNVKLEFADALASGFTTSDGRVLGLSEQGVNQRWRLLALNMLDAASGPAGLPSPATYMVNRSWALLRQQQMATEASQTSLLPAIELGSRGHLPIDLRNYLTDQARRSLEKVALSLIAYRLDHGELPESLRNLVPEYSPHGVEVDPFSFQWFEYRPQGLDLPLVTTEMTINEFIPPKTPVLWSAGPGFVELRERWGHETGAFAGSPLITWLNSQYDSERFGQASRDSSPLKVQMLVPTGRSVPDDSTILLTIPTSAAELKGSELE
jgi:hypothetical protein